MGPRAARDARASRPSAAEPRPLAARANPALSAYVPRAVQQSWVRVCWGNERVQPAELRARLLDRKRNAQCKDLRSCVQVDGASVHMDCIERVEREERDAG